MRTVVYGALLTVVWLGFGQATEARAQQQELPSFHIVVKDGRFAPDRVEVPAGRRVKLTLQNDGPGSLEFENDEMHIEKVLSAGARSFVILPPLKPGEYDFVDEFNPITGELKVIVK